MSSPLAGRKVPKGKRSLRQRSMADVIAQGRSASGGVGASTGLDHEALKQAAREAMGQSDQNSSVAVVEDHLQYMTPEEAWDAYQKKEYKTAEGITVALNLGVITEEEADELTPKKAIAIIQDIVEADMEDVERAAEKKTGKKAKPKIEKKAANCESEDDDEDKEPKKKVVKKKAKKRRVVKKKAAAKKKTTKAPRKKVAKMKPPRKKDSKPEEPSKSGMDYPEGQERDEEIVEGKKEAQYAAPPATSQPTQNTVQPGQGTNLVPGQQVQMTDSSGRTVTMVVQADGSMKPVAAAAPGTQMGPVAAKKKKESQQEQTNTDEPSGSAGKPKSKSDTPSEPKTDRNSVSEKTAINYTAKRTGKRWLVMANGEASFSVGIQDAHPNEEDEYLDMFNSDQYGEELAAACNLRGAATVIKDVYKGRAKLEFQKTPFDFEYDLMDAIENRRGDPNRVIAAYAKDFPKESKEIVALYNRDDINDTDLPTEIRKLVASRKGQYNQYGLGDMSERQTAPDSSVQGDNPDLAQEGNAVMDDEVTDQMAAKEKDRGNIVELFAEVMSPIIAISDVWEIDDVIRQMKETFSDDEKIARFKGILEEKVSQDKEDNEEIIREKSPQELEAQKKKKQVQENQQVQAIKKGLELTLQKVKKQAQKLQSDFDITVSELNKEHKETKAKLKTANAQLAVADKEFTAQKELTERLVKERSARLKLPKAKKLHEKIKKIGIKSSLTDIILYTDEEFANKETEVDSILNKMQDISREGEYKPDENLIGGSLPALDQQEAGESEQKNPFSSRAPK